MENKKVEETRTPEKIKKSLKRNTIKLIIGIGLLIACFCYIKKNPAEAVSISSSYTTIVKNIEVFFQNIFGDNGDLLKRKYDLEDYFETLITTAEDKGCIDQDTMDDLKQTYEDLLVEPKNNLLYSLDNYIEKAFFFDEEVKKDCTKTKEKED